MQRRNNAGQSHILDQLIPGSLRRGLVPTLIRTPSKKELKRLQKQFKRNIVTRNVSKAFDQNLNDYSFGSGETDVQDLEIFFVDVRQYIKQIVSRKLKRYIPTGAGVSFYLVLVTSIRNKQQAETGEIDQYFTRSRRHHVLNNSEIDETINIIFDELRTKFSTFIATSTNIEVLKIIRLDMHIDRYEPIIIKTVINIQNQDNRCFLYAVESALMNSVTANPSFYVGSITKRYRS